jgi:hypothetical protein
MLICHAEIEGWGKPWYDIGIVGNLGLILYVITLLPGNPVTGRGGNIDITAIICESGQVSYIVITATILAKERHRIKSK